MHTHATNQTLIGGFALNLDDTNQPAVAADSAAARAAMNETLVGGYGLSFEALHDADCAEDDQVAVCAVAARLRRVVGALRAAITQRGPRVDSDPLRDAYALIDLIAGHVSNGEPSLELAELLGRWQRMDNAKALRQARRLLRQAPLGPSKTPIQ